MTPEQQLSDLRQQLSTELNWHKQQSIKRKIAQLEKQKNRVSGTQQSPPKQLFEI